MHQDELQERLTRTVAENFGVHFDQVSRTTELATLSADSIGALEFTMAVEDALEIEIPDSALDRMRTLGEVTDYLADRLGL